nr:MAG TPA: protein of unknown function DUF529 [Caudoviricetes sp.]
MNIKKPNLYYSINLMENQIFKRNSECGELLYQGKTIWKE